MLVSMEDHQWQMVDYHWCQSMECHKLIHQLVVVVGSKMLLPPNNPADQRKIQYDLWSLKKIKKGHKWYIYCIPACVQKRIIHWVIQTKWMLAYIFTDKKCLCLRFSGKNLLCTVWFRININPPNNTTLITTDTGHI